jgi:hypothetical protein
VRLSRLNWAGVIFGSVAGLFTIFVLFVLSFGLGSNAFLQIALLLAGFFVAGHVAGRFALVEPTLSGGMAALILFFGLVVFIVKEVGLTTVGIVVLGMIVTMVGNAGGALGHRRQKD